MGKHETITHSLPLDLAEAMQVAVDAGRYNSSDEIVLDALYAWQHRQEYRAFKLQRLQEMIAEGRKGEGRPADEVFAELRERVLRRIGETEAQAES